MGPAPARPPHRVVRYGRAARWFHAALYVVAFALLGTGWWLRTGHEGQPSVLAHLVGRPDVEVHRWAGWVLAGILLLGITAGIRGAVTFVRETMRVDRGDGRWLRRWPVGALTGRFASHEGHFDPGQRIANVGFVVTLTTLVLTGIGLTTIHGGPRFVVLDRLHLIATYALTALVAGHVLVAVGVLPGYRGAWRSMHLGGRISAATAARLWPRSAAIPTSAPDGTGGRSRSAGRPTRPPSRGPGPSPRLPR